MSFHTAPVLDFVLRHKILTFGDFTLKSGRKSPYFFNTGALHTGANLLQLGRLYANYIDAQNYTPDVLFGPAYKGIPLAVATTCALVENGHDVSYCFNRKEKKDHGEGGTLVGKPPTNKTIVLDDVLTAGTAVSETLTNLTQHGIQPQAVIVLLDRQEHNSYNQPASKAISAQFNLPVHALITLDDVIAYTHKHQLLTKEDLKRITEYRLRFAS